MARVILGPARCIVCRQWVWWGASNTRYGGETVGDIRCWRDPTGYRHKCPGRVE